MHLSEFQAWFEGFTEEMDGPPSEKQWKKIKARVKDITPYYTPAPVFIDRYIRPWRRYYDEPYWTRLTATGSAERTISQSDWSAAGKAEYLAGTR